MVMLLASTIAGAQIVINHFHNPGHGQAWTEWIQERAREYEALNPGVKIDINVPGEAMGPSHFLTYLAAGVNMDVTELINAGAGQVAPHGLLTDLRPYFERDASVSLDDFVPAALNALTWTDGKIVGFPMDIYVVPTHFNADLFAQAGLPNPIDLDEDWTYDAALDAAKKITRDRDGDGELDQWGTNSGPRMWDYYTGVYNQGASWYDRPINPTESRLNSEKTVAALQWIADLYLVHEVHAPNTITTWSGGLQTGQIAWTTSEGPSVAAAMERAGVTFEWGVAMPIAGEKRGALVVSNSFQIPESAQNKDAAWEWIKFLGASMEGLTSFVAHTSRLPANLSAIPRWFDQVQALSNPPIGLENYVHAASHPDSFPTVMGAKAGEINSITTGIFNQVVTGEISPRAALEDAHQRVNLILQSE